MKYLDYKENRQHGTFDFPIAFYHVSPSHPRYNMPYHWHTEYEIIRIISGEFLLTLNGNELKLKTGDLAFIHAGILHGGTPIDCVYECIVFDMKSLLKVNSTCSKQIQDIIHNSKVINSLLPTDNLELQTVCNYLFESMAQKKLGYELVTQGSLYHLLGIILEHRLYSTPKEATSKNQQRINQFKNVLSLIEQQYPDPLTLEDLSKAAGMTPKYFCRFFRGMTQRSPIDYLNYYRIESSCEQLVSTNESITEIALNCGFNDISYFIKTFKKYKGVTPKQYLKDYHAY
ncbi:AraC family transcriptional regulator [Clostridium cellulovorans]|uniref:Transcriptional regulator, AraC family n=1 Tax=Clostridium cellulovorans (strain ATCC 35296 / DSM 3052 / OCM 3 / 743B) TaxID=573061 RepID=D9SWA4_CLOC7|nr:AraC family transcriptional regulator [Clostridium cellulovorans]ADL51248.1 transcriptional regulator, AraC family [Clostridium cellulovorans 743B]